MTWTGPPRIPGALAAGVLTAMALSWGPAVLAAQLVPPDADWRTLETPHFRVTYAAGLESLARRAGAAAERTRTALARDLEIELPATVHILVSDHTDFANGFASVVPRDRIVVFARPPTQSPGLVFNRDWIELVVVHELAHVAHLNTTGGLGRLLRRVFGRPGSGWPIFPQTATPTWSIEGLATYYESRFTGAGRAHGSFHDMVLRTATLEDAFEPLDRVSGDSPIWPAGDRRYVYGSRFLTYLSERFGPEVQAQLVHEAATSVLPPTIVFDRIAERAAGTPFSELYRDWRRHLAERYEARAAEARARGLTPSEALTVAGRWAAHPRVSPGGGHVAFAAADSRSVPATRIIDLATGAVEDVARRNQFGNLLGPPAWLPDGSGFVLAQLELHDTYRQWHDLYRVTLDGREERLTRGARISQPDVAPDGRRVAAVQGHEGRTRLVVYDLADRAIRPLTPYEDGVAWSLPRWSPDGSRLAAGRWREGGFLDVVLVDSDGRITELTRDHALDDAPAWSPDGRWVVFWSDRSGIPNIYAADVSGRPAAPCAPDCAPGCATDCGVAREPGSERAAPPPLRQVTNVLTGAFDPELSPDGRWLYVTRYHADGYHIERLPFEPGRWLDAPPSRIGMEAPVRPAGHEPGDGAGEAGAMPAGEVGSGGDGAGASTTGTAPGRPYSAWSTLGPTWWGPVVDDDGAGQYFFGVEMGGADVVGIHDWEAQVGYNFDQGWIEMEADYAYAGLGNPVVGLGIDRDWGRLGVVREGDEVVDQLFSRRDRVTASLTTLRRRWRSSAGVAVGGELQRERIELRDADREVDGPGTLAGGFLQPFFANVRRYPYSISREDGISTFVTVRRLFDLQPEDDGDGSFTEVNGRFAGFRGMPLPGFANHVVAVRLSGLLRTGDGAAVVPVGGASGTAETVLFAEIGGPSLFLPVRGFRQGAQRGTRAWTTSLEYRVPVALVGRGIGLWPAFLDRVSATAFVDAGHAWCTDAQRERLGTVCGASDTTTLLSAGVELAADVLLFFDRNIRGRVGLAAPIDPGGDPSVYVRFGASF